MKILKISEWIIKYVKDKSQNTEYKSQRAHVWAKIFYLFILAYFLALSFVSLDKNNLTGFILFVILFLFGVIILIGNVMHYSGKINSFSIKTHNIYAKIYGPLLKIAVGNKNEKIPLKPIFKRLGYLAWFFFIPVFFLIVILSTKWGYIAGSGAVMGSFSFEEAYNEYRNDGVVSIAPILDNSRILKLSYIVGNLFDIPILDICFINNGTFYEKDLLNETFISIVNLEDNNFSIPYKGEYCTETGLKNKMLGYEWITTYKYSIRDRQVVNGSIDLTNNPSNEVKVKINENFFIMAFLILIGWLGFSHLIYSILRNFNEIK